MTDRETLEMFLSYKLNSADEIFQKFLTLENSRAYENDCVYVPGTRKDRVLLIAHADTVFYRNSHKFLCDEDDVYRSLEDDCGIGADDRAGCAILWLLKDSGHSLLITNDEESGSLGAKSIRENHKEFFAELNDHQYMIEFDRRHSHDYKVYDIPVTQEFKRFIEANTGYREADKASSTDIRVLCEKICGVNLSVGYYKEYRPEECLVFSEWKNTLDLARKMLEPEQQKFPLVTQKGIRMDKLIKIFADTQKFYKSDPVLKEAVKFGKQHTTLYEASDYPELTDAPKKLGAAFTVKLRSFQTAIKFHKGMPDKKIAVLNFASSIKPGGGVYVGSRAQEECLCRCSTLYPLLDRQWLKESYYIPNKKHFNFRNNDTCIYSEGVVICKSDDDYPVRLNHEDFVAVDVITCAAPDLRKATRCDIQELFDIHVHRAKHILHVAALHDVDVLITGAFGCGAFKNPPELVAEAWKEALKDYRHMFEYVIFAVYAREHELNNLKAFAQRFNLN